MDNRSNPARGHMDTSRACQASQSDIAFTLIHGDFQMAGGIPNLARGLSISGDDRALCDTLIDNTTAEVFHEVNRFWDPKVCGFKELADGETSHVFPFEGDPGDEAEHHVAGQYIEGSSAVQGSVQCDVDEPLHHAHRIPEVDRIHSKFPLFENKLRISVRKVTEKLNKRMGVCLALAARTSALANVHGGGKAITRAVSGGQTETDAYPVSEAGAATLEGDFSRMAQKYDEDSIPKKGRVAFIEPWLVSVATRSAKLMSVDYNIHPEWADYAQRIIGMMEGFVLIDSVYMPKTAITTGPTKYQGDFSVAGSTGRPVALFSWSGEGKAPVAVVRKGGVLSRLSETPDNDTHLLRARAITGAVPWCAWLAGELRVKAG